MVNIVSQPPLYAYTTHIFDRADNMLNLRWGFLTGATVVKKDVWDRVPADLQKKLLEIGEEYGERTRKDVRKQNQDAIEQMKKRGLTINQPADIEEWRKVAERAHEVIRGSVVPAAIYDEVVRLRDEFAPSTSADALPAGGVVLGHAGQGVQFDALASGSSEVAGEDAEGLHVLRDDHFQIYLLRAQALRLEGEVEGAVVAADPPGRERSGRLEAEPHGTDCAGRSVHPDGVLAGLHEALAQVEPDQPAFLAGAREGPAPGGIPGKVAVGKVQAGGPAADGEANVSYPDLALPG